ncbi:MAG: hypothetical protein M3416_00170 [Acidobacteriota bacterium]|nr:hypothetical protein [Acidobacteriota bacterium]
MNEDQIKVLIEAAKKGMESAYGVGAGVPLYGAAVLTPSGNIYSAGQYKAETRQISLHAEQAALVHAAAHGKREIVAITIISNEDTAGEMFTNPCGICKQALYEHAYASGLPMKIILANLRGHWEVRDLKELIVFPWPT